MNGSGTKVDVLLPVYNGARTLAQALQSLADQTLQEIRVLIIDDGSTDSSPDIARQFAAADPRFVHVRQCNGGIVSALNAGLEMVRAPYVARLDADDVSDPDRLRAQVEMMEREPDIVALGCQARYINAEGEPLPGHTNHMEIRPDYAAVPAREPYIMHPFLIMRTTTFRTLSGYRHVPHAEDTDLYWRAFEIGRLHNLPDVLGAYRVHSESISSLSVLNGRVQAVASQLAAVSARRRAERRPDIVFEPSLKIILEEAAELETMVAVLADRLTPAELAYMRVAVAAKHLATSFYRSYRLTTSDLRFARSAFDSYSLEAGASQSTTVIAARVSRRLLRAGRLRDAFIMTPATTLALGTLKWAAAKVKSPRQR